MADFRAVVQALAISQSLFLQIRTIVSTDSSCAEV